MRFTLDARLAAGVFFLLVLAGCATPQTSALRGVAHPNFATRTELQNIAYFPQEENQCGPASLAMVMHSLGLDIAPDDLKDSMYIPDKKGSLQVEMLATARKYGLLAYLLRPELEDVLTEISAGNPVIILQNLGLSWYPLWHYTVAIGYDLDKEEIILRSGSSQRLSMPFFTFEHTWARSHYWAMVALPPSRIPRTAQAESYIQTLAALQHSSPATDVGPAYTAALLHWPDNQLVNLTAGNDAYNRGNLKMAEQLFSKATQEPPESAAAFNNLAQTLSDQGKYDAALEAIHHALQIGGPLVQIMRNTFAEIEQKKRAAQQGCVK